MTIAVPALDLRQLRIIPLPSEHALDKFRSGEDEIDRYLGKCCEWQQCHRARVFCAYIGTDADPYGFFCLGQHAHDSKIMGGFFARASDDVRNFVPFIYLNYLAVRLGFRRQKIGTMLLLNALERCAIAMRQIGAYGVALNALTEGSFKLYEKYGFRSQNPERQRHPLMVLPAQSIIDLFPG
jgi:ribosomal protein S18 acetylase RimI-like enzyme